MPVAAVVTVVAVAVVVTLMAVRVLVAVGVLVATAGLVLGFGTGRDRHDEKGRGSGFGEFGGRRGAREPGADVLDVRDGLFEQLADVVVVEVVDDAAPVAAPDDQAEVPQQPQLV